jgi:hypothetical protein
MLPFDINSVGFHFDDFNYGRRSQPCFFLTIATQLVFFHWIMPFVSSTLKRFDKRQSPLFGATGNFNHQILPYGILFLAFIITNVFYKNVKVYFKWYWIMSPFDINSIVFHFDDFNYGRRSQPCFFLTIVTQLVFFHNLIVNTFWRKFYRHLRWGRFWPL